jgi:hypothetical protein
MATYYGALCDTNPIVAIGKQLAMTRELIKENPHLPIDVFHALAVADIQKIYDQVCIDALVRASTSNPAFAALVETVPLADIEADVAQAEASFAVAAE